MDWMRFCRDQEEIFDIITADVVKLPLNQTYIISLYVYISSDNEIRMIAAASTQLKTFTRAPSARVSRRSAHVCAAARPTWYPGMFSYLHMYARISRL